MSAVTEEALAGNRLDIIKHRRQALVAIPQLQFTHAWGVMLDKRVAAKASAYLTEYSIEKGIYMKINYFNADHTHALIDLPTRYSIEEVIKLFKGGSSYWINHSQIIKGKFAWGGGYGAFSVSHSDVARVARYIANQEEHHRKWTLCGRIRVVC